MRISKLKAFTMAEAILVMTILGIIATIMITTLKPAQFKDQGLEIMARKVMSEIDTAVTQMLINDAQGGSLTNLIDPAAGSQYSFANTTKLNSTVKIMKKYLTTTRQDSSGTYCSTKGTKHFYLKDGACVGVYAYATAPDTAGALFPGESGSTQMGSTSTSRILGVLYIDTNGNKEPNAEGKDQFVFPIGNEGIIYSAE